MGRRTKRTPARETRFLAALSSGQSVAAAAAAAGFGCRTAYDWRRGDAEFAARWDDAVEEGTDRLEDEALRRAVEGFDKPLYYRGTKVGDVRQFSDALLMFLLRGRRPGKYGKYPQHHLTDPANAGDGPIGIDYAGLSELDITQRLTVLAFRLAEVDAAAQIAGGNGALGARERPREPADSDAAGPGAGKPGG